MLKPKIAILPSPDLKGILSQFALGVVATMGVSTAVAALGWMSPGPSDPSVLPGALVALIWSGLIGGLCVARWIAGRSSGVARRQQGPIVAIIVASLAYPFYTAGLTSLTIGLGANVAIAVCCALVADRLFPTSRFAAILVGLPIPWLVFASVLIGREWILTPT